MFKSFIKKIAPELSNRISYYRRYTHAVKLMKPYLASMDDEFAKLHAFATPEKACLQVGVRGQKHAPHWKVIDLYDKNPLVDYNNDVQDMPFEDASFDVVVCSAILEHVPYPQKAIAEIYRILKPNGHAWVDIPFNQPYHPSPQDYWRVSPEGMRIWMQDFEEIKLGVRLISGSSIYNNVYFHGRKV